MCSWKSAADMCPGHGWAVWPTKILQWGFTRICFCRGTCPPSPAGPASPPCEVLSLTLSVFVNTGFVPDLETKSPTHCHPQPLQPSLSPWATEPSTYTCLPLDIWELHQTWFISHPYISPLAQERLASVLGLRPRL